MSGIQQGKSYGCKWVRSHEYPTCKASTAGPTGPHAALIFIERAVAKAKRNGLKGWDGKVCHGSVFNLFCMWVPHGMRGPCGRWWSQLVMLGPTLRHQAPALIRCSLVFGSRPIWRSGWSIKVVVFWSQIQFSSKWLWWRMNGETLKMVNKFLTRIVKAASLFLTTKRHCHQVCTLCFNLSTNPVHLIN